MEQEQQKDLLTTVEAAAHLTIAVRTLEHWREIGCGPRYVKLNRAVRYRRSVLDQFLEDRELTHTSQPAPSNAKRKRRSSFPSS